MLFRTQDTTEEQLTEIFGKFPNFKKIRFVRIRDLAFVDFENVSSATHSINQVRQTTPWMHINYAKQ